MAVIGSGDLDKLAAFSAPVKDTDANGKRIQGYDHQFQTWVKVHPLRGGESVMQARLVSKSPAILTVMSSPDSLRITSEWRVTINDRTYDVKEDPREAQGGALLEMLVERVG